MSVFFLHFAWSPVKAAASPATVAIINVSGPEATALSSSLYDDVRQTSGLVPINKGILQKILASSDDSDGATYRINALQQAFEAGKQARLSGKLESAESTLRTVIKKIAYVPMNETVRGLLSNAHFELGLVSFLRSDISGGQDFSQAAFHFALAQRVNPQRPPPDQARFLPSVVSLYKKADMSTQAAQPFQLSYIEDGATIWLDGRQIGKSPVTVEVPTGYHYITVLADDSPTLTKLLKLERSVQLLYPRGPGIDQRVSALKQSLKGSKTDLAKRRILGKLARLCNANWIIILEDRDGLLGTTVYELGRGVLTPWLATKGRANEALLAPLTFAITPITPPAKSWWKSKSGKAVIVSSAVATTAAIVLAIVFSSNSGAITVSWGGF